MGYSLGHPPNKSDGIIFLHLSLQRATCFLSGSRHFHGRLPVVSSTWKAHKLATCCTFCESNTTAILRQCSKDATIIMIPFGATHIWTEANCCIRVLVFSDENKYSGMQAWLMWEILVLNFWKQKRFEGASTHAKLVLKVHCHPFPFSAWSPLLKMTQWLRTASFLPIPQ